MTATISASGKTPRPVFRPRRLHNNYISGLAVRLSKFSPFKRVRGAAGVARSKYTAVDRVRTTRFTGGPTWKSFRFGSETRVVTRRLSTRSAVKLCSYLFCIATREKRENSRAVCIRYNEQETPRSNGRRDVRSKSINFYFARPTGGVIGDHRRPTGFRTPLAGTDHR